MKKILLVAINAIFGVYLCLQIRELFIIEQEKVFQEDKSKVALQPVKVDGCKYSISITELYYFIYNKDENTRIININFNDNKTIAEIEMDVKGDINYLGKTIDDLKTNKAFAGIKRYEEVENSLKKLVIIFNIKG